MTKFVGRLRRRFSHLFMKTLEKQLILKGIVAEADWSELANLINFDFTIDNHFEEFKEAEVLQNRINTLNQITPYIGRYFSDIWVRKNILKQSEKEIAEMMDQMESETTPEMAPIPDGQERAPAPVANKPNIQTSDKQSIPGTGEAY